MSELILPARARLTRPASWLLIVVLLLSGCNLPTGGTTDNPPAIALRQPADGSAAMLGEPVRVVAHATDDKGIVRVELWTDGTLTSQHEADSPAGLASFNAAFVWTPPTAGLHTLQVMAIDTAGQTTTSEEVTIDAQAAPTPVPTVTATSTTTPTPAPPTSTPGPTPAEEPAVTADNVVNVRNGPGIAYTKLGELTAGQTVRATGRNEDKTWWQIAFASGPDGKGWVFAELVTANDSAQDLPVATAPVLPTAGPTAVLPTRTPTPAPSVIWADRTTIAAGECTTLHWKVENVTEVYLDDEGVGGEDSRQKCPAVSTTYTLHVWRGQTETPYPLTITVTGSVTCSGEPLIEVPLGATASNVAVGEEFSLVWSVTNIKGVWLVADGTEYPEAGTGSLNGIMAWHAFRYDEPGTHKYYLKLQKCDNSFITTAEVTVKVHS